MDTRLSYALNAEVRFSTSLNSGGILVVASSFSLFPAVGNVFLKAD